MLPSMAQGVEGELGAVWCSGGGCAYVGTLWSRGMEAQAVVQQRAECSVPRGGMQAYSTMKGCLGGPWLLRS